jgi:hypothetical protein
MLSLRAAIRVNFKLIPELRNLLSCRAAENKATCPGTIVLKLVIIKPRFKLVALLIIADAAIAHKLDIIILKQRKKRTTNSSDANLSKKLLGVTNLVRRCMDWRNPKILNRLSHFDHTPCGRMRNTYVLTYRQWLNFIQILLAF